VVCRNCGIEIADKALICYRCGTATTEPKFKAPGRRPSTSPLLWTVIAVALLAVMALVISRTTTGETSRALSYAAVTVAALVVILRAYLRRRQ
jgi:bacteriorhodopsin